MRAAEKTVAGSAADGASTSAKAGAGKPCPICGKAAADAYRPFCSKRCADVDLSRWLNGVYVLSGEEGAAGDDDE